MNALEQQQRARVCEVALSWVGTPYHHAARIKHVGVDCATLLAEVFTEAGLTPPLELPKYSPQWHLHRNIEVYRSYVERHLHEIQTPPLPGDVVLYQWGHVKAHGGIIVDPGWPHIVHAYARARFAIMGEGDGGELAGRDTQFFSYW